MKFLKMIACILMCTLSANTLFSSQTKIASIDYDSIKSILRTAKDSIVISEKNIKYFDIASQKSHRN